MPNKILDFRGEECPEPIIKTSRVLSKMKKGDSMTILTDIEECVRLIKELIDIFNVEELDTKKVNDHWIIKVVM